MGKSLYDIPSSNSLIVDDVKEESLEVVDAGTNQEINVYGGSVTPELPKVLDNEQINVYAPVAGKTFPGLAFFNSSHFSITVGGFVSLLKGGIESIEKVATNGLVETWAVFLTDGRVEYFTITNGATGDDGPQGPPGPVGPKGDGLEIKKVYYSVDEMWEDFSNEEVPFGGVVIITTDDVNNPDNSKLFVKHKDGFHYLNDLSGAQGIQGPPGYTPILGTDYFTDADKQQIVKRVIEELPWAEGVSV
jgi:hypothetical protein